jgi:mono/diheme cytochrome c family protein
VSSTAKALAIAALLAPALAQGQELGNPKAGLEFAKRACAECHEVEAVEAFSPHPDAPPFKQVADTPGMTARALGVWLTTSHPTMPDFILPPEDMDNVIAYILSLRTRP